MSLRDLIQEIHKRSIWQVLAVYLASAAVGYQLIEALVSGLNLPGWFPALAILLFVVGLPIVLATAVVQRGGPSVSAVDPTLLPQAQAGGKGVGGPGTPGARSGVRRLFTWRNAILGGLLAFAGWGVVATGWLLLAGPGRESSAETADADRRRMLVVLPFENLGPTEHEYFADGITDEITSRLAAIGGLGVISRTSAVQYKGTDKALPKIGEELGVDYVLEGTILWQHPAEGPSRVRVTPQLIRVDDDTHVWADRYDAVLSDIFDVQSKIASQVIDALNVALAGREREALGARPTENLEAYDYYLRGKDYANRSIERSDFEVAIDLFDRAIELDPGFAEAYAALSLAHDYLFWFYDQNPEQLARARRAAERALELDPDLPEAHIAQAYYYYHGLLDYERALEQLTRARALRPNDAALWAVTAFVQRRQGRWEASTSSLDRAMELDPLSTRYQWNQCYSYTFLSEYVRAEQHCDRAISLAPDIAESYGAKAFMNSKAGRLEANRELLEELETRGDHTAVLQILVDVWYDVSGPLFRIQPEYAAGLARIELASVSDTAQLYLSRTRLYGASPGPEVERAYYDSAAAVLQSRLSQIGESDLLEANTRSLLGYAYAGVGRWKDAVREAERAVELMPVSANALEGPGFLAALVEVYVMTGRHDKALEQLDYLLSVPSPRSAAQLQADPLFAPLRDDPDFQALLRRHAP